jgi:hypothetical protein
MVLDADHTPSQQAKPDRALQSTDRATHNVILGGDCGSRKCGGLYRFWFDFKL